MIFFGKTGFYNNLRNDNSKFKKMKNKLSSLKNTNKFEKYFCL